MMIRIGLLVAVLTAAATMMVSFFGVRPQMQKLITERNDYATKASTQTARANKAEAAARQTAEKLTAAQAQLESMAQESRILKNERTQLSSRLDEVTSKFAAASQDLARWNATGAKPEQVA